MESVLRQLCDKSYERRRQAAAELQKNIKQNLDNQNYDAIHKLIEQFKDDYLDNQNEVYKKAGLIAFSAIAIALSEYSNSTEFYTSIIIPVVGCFRDFAATVRYASIEAMYNIVKVLRSEILPFFPNIFRGMIELFADVDTDVRRAAQQLDSILKSIIVESEANPTIFDSEKFMSLIYDMVKGARNPSVQQMLVSWLLVLDSIPSFDLLYYLPNFVEGFFLMLASQNKDVKQSVFNCLKDFLEEIKCSKRIAEMRTLIGHMVQLSTHSESFVRSVANTWINELLAECPLELASQFPNCLQAILKFLSDSEKQIVDLADKTNTAMIQYIEEIFRQNEASCINFEYLVEVLMDHIDHPSMKTSKAVLDWIAKLQIVCPDSIKTSLDHILETLTTRLRDPHESVIQQALEVLCTIAGYEGYFNKVISSVVRMFENNSDLMTQQGAAIIRTLCSSLGVERVYSCFAEVLYYEPTSSFVKRMIELLNELLLTDAGFGSLRERLKYCLERDDKECLELFEKIFCTW
jgi:vacuole morphology and inheritance protein 14